MTSNQVKTKIKQAKWEELIVEANQQIVKSKQRIAFLRKTIRDLTKIRDSGEKWPTKPDNEALSAAPERGKDGKS